MSKTVKIKSNFNFNDLNPLELDLQKLNLSSACPIAEISYAPSQPNGVSPGDSSEEQRKLFIGSINLTTTGEELINHFSKYGEVERININYDFKSGQTQGYAFVVFKNKNIVQKVLASGDSIFDYSSNKTVIEERKKIKARKNKNIKSGAVETNGANVEDNDFKTCDIEDDAKKCQARKRKRNKAKAGKQYLLVENIIHLNETDISNFFAKYIVDLYYPVDQDGSNKDYCILSTNDKTQSDAILKISRPIINGIKLRIHPMRNMPDDYLLTKNRDIEDFKLFYGDSENGEVVLEPVN